MQKRAAPSRVLQPGSTKRVFVRGRTPGMAAMIAARKANLRGVPRSSALELKYLDTAVVTPFTFGTATATNITCLNTCTLGTDSVNRIGRKIVMKSMRITGAISIAATTTNSSPLRVIVVYDKQPNAALAAATDVLLVDSITSPNNLNNRERFNTLADMWFPCIGTAGPQSVCIDRYVKMNHEAIFNATNGGTIADLTTGAVVVLFYNNGNLGVASPVGNFRFRIRFDDA